MIEQKTFGGNELEDDGQMRESTALAQLRQWHDANPNAKIISIETRRTTIFGIAEFTGFRVWFESEPETEVNEKWVRHAYPLQQLTIKLQGTRHSDKAAVIAQLEDVFSRLKAGDTSGADHDDDFGYDFEYVQAASGPSFFDEPAGHR